VRSQASARLISAAVPRHFRWFFLGFLLGVAPPVSHMAIRASRHQIRANRFRE
jgi:hypothetical protein